MNIGELIAKRADKEIYRNGDKVIKIFYDNYSKANILNEALNQTRVEEISVNIPKLLEVSKIDGKWAITVEYIEGVTLEQLMKENPDKTDEYLRRMVDLQVQILSHNVPMLNKLKDKMHNKIKQTGLDATTRYELHTRLDGVPKHYKVCHGDFNPSNIIITPDDKAYVIDWAHVTQGNASADAARTYLLFSITGETETAEKYLELFCKKTDTAKQYVQMWIPIVAASQLSKGIESEREFLMRWIDVVQYE